MTFETIKFFYNGIKINNEKSLIKIRVYEHDDGINIIYDWHWDGEFFKAIQEIAEYTVEPAKYWDDDPDRRIVIRKDNPLYPCFKYMVLANKLRDFKHYEKTTGNGKDKIEEIENEMKNLPKIADSTVDAAKTYIIGVNEEIKRQKEIKRQEEEAERKRIFDEEAAQKMVIDKYMKQFPIGNEKTYVKICWSEHPAFYSWDDDTLKLSVKAAELIFTELDKKPVGGGYYKTKFNIILDGDEENGYIGRYDLGDEEGGLINHILNFANYEYKNNGNSETYREYIEFINKLMEVYDRTVEVTEVKISEEFKKFVEIFKKNKEDQK